MTDSLLPPPTDGSFSPGIPTPSGLTPNTRSEAEAALSLNSLTQTESAAPTTPGASHHGRDYPGMTGEEADNIDGVDGGADEALRAYRRPTGPMRTSSTNYEKALLRAREQSSISSDISTATTTTDVSFPSEVRKASISITPGQGVVPVIPEGGVSAGQTEALKRQRPRGLSLAELGRKQSWSEQDMKHLYSAHLMDQVEGNDKGYGSGAEGRGVGS